jgi:hypothetical protein
VKMAVDDDGSTRVELSIDEGDLRCFSIDGNSTYRGGGPRRSLCDGWLGLGHGVPAWRRVGRLARVFTKLSSGHRYIKVWFDLLVRAAESNSYLHWI